MIILKHKPVNRSRKHSKKEKGSAGQSVHVREGSRV